MTIQTRRLVLASGSPRRRELLALLGVPFDVVVTDAEDQEDAAPPEVVSALPPLALPLSDHPALRAWRKADAAAASHSGGVILGADTIVVLGGEVLNKPQDAAHARTMLARLAGRVHTVYTGLCVITTDDGRQPAAPEPGNAGSGRDPAHRPSSIVHRPSSTVHFDLVASDVTIAALSEEQIARYVATGEPLDKAGAYGIQGLGGQLVRQVVGSYTAVVGLPLPATWQLLGTAGIAGLAEPEAAYRHWLSILGKEPLPCPPTLP